MPDRLNAIENQIDQHLEQLDAEQARFEAVEEWFESLDDEAAYKLLSEFVSGYPFAMQFIEWLEEYGTAHDLFPFDKRPDE